MYNEELKVRFLRQYTNSISTINTATYTFNKFEPYEIEWEADLCTQSKSVLQPIIDEIVGIRVKSKWAVIIMLKEYVKWCISNNVQNACTGMLEIGDSGLNKIRKQMVSNPVHLQLYLDSVFEKESEKTMDNVYRAYFWLAFSGVPETSTMTLTADNIVFEEMCIRINDKEYPLYKESLPSIRNCITIESFSYIHPLFDKPVLRPRVSGNNILRGYRSDTNMDTMRSVISRRTRAAEENKTTESKLSYKHVLLSGMFYRKHELEVAGVEPDFTYEAISMTSGKEYKFNKYYNVQHLQNRFIRDYMEDYNRWKLAFRI